MDNLKKASVLFVLYLNVNSLCLVSAGKVSLDFLRNVILQGYFFLASVCVCVNKKILQFRISPDQCQFRIPVSIFEMKEVNNAQSLYI